MAKEKIKKPQANIIGLMFIIKIRKANTSNIQRSQLTRKIPQIGKFLREKL